MMNDILYLSSLCSKSEYNRMFELYGSTLSHASQKFNRLLVRGLIENGCSVEALSEIDLPIGVTENIKRPEEAEDHVRYVYLPRYANTVFNRIATIWNTIRYIKKWKRKHHDGTIICDVILGELSIAVWLSGMFKKMKTTAIVTDVPSIRAGDKRKGIKALPVKIKNSMIATYKSYIFLTQQMNASLNPHNKPYVIVEGLVDESVTEQPNILANKHPEKVIMMAGLLEDIYGVNTLLQGFMRVKCNDARIKFYGKGSSVEKIIEASKMDGRISYCGELANSDIVEEEKKATLLINPRPPVEAWTAYSFPSKNMEYMASGTPLVAFDLPCIPNDYKEYFYHINEYTAEEIGNMLQSLLDKERIDLHKFGICAQTWIVNNKNPKMQMKQYVESIIMFPPKKQ